MDTTKPAEAEMASQGNQTGCKPQRQRRSIAEKRRIVEETLVEGASVARVARAHGVNANQVFGWRRLYRAGRLGVARAAMKLLPVRVRERTPLATRTAHREHTLSAERALSTARVVSGTIHVELRHAQVHIAGNADPGLLRVLLECLAPHRAKPGLGGDPGLRA